MFTVQGKLNVFSIRIIILRHKLNSMSVFLNEIDDTYRDN